MLGAQVKKWIEWCSERAELQGACLATSVVKRVGSVTPECEPKSPKTQSSPGLDYLLFVTEGFVSLLEGDKKILGKMWHDTGAFDSFIVMSVLPFSENFDTGDYVPVIGMSMNVLKVPLHKIRLFSDLFQGEAQMGVRPALPIDATMILIFVMVWLVSVYGLMCHPSWSRQFRCLKASLMIVKGSFPRCSLLVWSLV